MNVHIRIVFHMTAKGTVEIPEPVGTKYMATRSPKRLVTLLYKTRPRLHHLTGTTHMESKMFAALQEWRGLNHEQGMVVLGTSRAQKWSRIGKAIGAAKAKTLRIKSLSFGHIRHEINDMRQASGFWRSVRICRCNIDRALRRCTGSIDCFSRQ